MVVSKDSTKYQQEFKDVLFEIYLKGQQESPSIKVTDFVEEIKEKLVDLLSASK